MRTLNLMDSKAVLEKHGIKLAESGLAKNIDEAMMIANSIKYPVAIKVVSDDVSHKTDMGGVAVGIQNDSEMSDAYKSMMAGMKKAKARVKGVMVQKMVKGAEVLIGGKRDPQFGQVVVFGMGGVMVEIMGDVSFRVAPIDKKQAMEMMAETKGFKILEGYRGKSYDVDAIATLLVKVSKMLEKSPKMAELDMNPVIALGKGAVPVDARIVMDD